MGWLKDDRTECWSVMTEMPVAQYLEFIRVAHAARGGIDGQRDVLKTTTAKRIRERMVADIRRGAVLPPVVLGSIVDETTFKSFPLSDAQTKPDDLVPKESQGSVRSLTGCSEQPRCYKRSMETLASEAGLFVLSFGLHSRSGP